MAVRFTEARGPIEDQEYYARLFEDMNADEHPFADVTIAMVRDIINNDIAAGFVGYSISRAQDPRHVLDFIEWWNALTTTRQHAMPVYPTRNKTVHRIAAVKDLCYVCYNNLQEEPNSNPPTMICTVCNNAAADAAADGTTERDEHIAAMVRGDLERLDHLLYKHRTLCRDRSPYRDAQRAGVLREFKTWVQRTPSSAAWIRAVNAQLYFHFRSMMMGMPSWMAKSVTNATMQIQAFDTLMMPQHAVLLRLDALNVISAEQKLAIRRTVHVGYLNNVEPWPEIPNLLRWSSQPDVLRQPTQLIETYEQRMQCTQLALIVRTLFRQHDPKQADNAMAMVPKLVYDFLGPIEYDEAELMKLWNLPLVSFPQPAGRDAADVIFILP